MLKWLKRLVVGALVLVIGLIVVAVGLIVGDSVLGAKASDFTNVTYTASDGTTLVGYLAQPEGEGPFPAVLMVHEWWGMNGDITEMADRLAEEGYVVLAPDTYRGATTSLIPRAIYLRVTVSDELVRADMRSAYDYLTRLENVDTGNVGAIGFCYGGGVALHHAVDNASIAATVNLYGDRILDPDAFGALLEEGAGPVLGIFGGVDNMIPLTEVEAFGTAMTDAGIENTISIYDEMGHAFVQPDVIDEDGQPRDAWLEILAFLEANLVDEQAQ